MTLADGVSQPTLGACDEPYLIRDVLVELKAYLLVCLLARLPANCKNFKRS
jgi:hypothetical protein